MQEITDVAGTIRACLAGVIHMSLATSVNNKPWVCELHFAVDDDLNMYWRSKTDRRHSQEIAINPFVAGTIVAQHSLSDVPRGVYFEGTAEQLHNVTEQDVAYQAYRSRFSVDEAVVFEAAQPEGHQFYKVTVSDWYLFDARESSPSQKYHLPMNRD